MDLDKYDDLLNDSDLMSSDSGLQNNQSRKDSVSVSDSSSDASGGKAGNKNGENDLSDDDLLDWLDDDDLLLDMDEEEMKKRKPVD